VENIRKVVYSLSHVNNPLYVVEFQSLSKYEPAPTLAAGLLRLARGKANLSQVSLAEIAGVSQQAVSAYETGKKDPTMETLQRLIRAAGLELRIKLEPLETHDEDMSNYLKMLSPRQRTLIERNQKERLAKARLQRVKGK
jgi:transcriptional regulator with XRE-family HTH domain